MALMSNTCREHCKQSVPTKQISTGSARITWKVTVQHDNMLQLFVLSGLDEVSKLVSVAIRFSGFAPKTDLVWLFTPDTKVKFFR